jgi:hypothetical protein
MIASIVGFLRGALAAGRYLAMLAKHSFEHRRRLICLP